MKNLDLNLLIKFITVCDTGSFTAAAEQLDVAKSILSEHITRLERDLGVQLLRRTTRKLVVTEAGEVILNAARATLENLQETVRSVQETHDSLSGKIRLTTSLEYASLRLAAQLATFAQLHTGIEVELIASDDKLDLLTTQIDLSIRVGWLTDSSHKALRIGTFQQLLVASPQYLKQHGTPTSPSHLNLNTHDWLSLTALSNKQWFFQQTSTLTKETAHPNARLSSNASSVIQQWLISGMGMSVLPDYQALTDIQAGRLVHLLPDWRLPEGGIFAVYPPNKHLPKRVRVLIDYLRDAGQNDGTLSSP